MTASTVGEMIARLLIGGVVVSVFAAMAEVFRPKSFAGLFSAAPSVALGTLGITMAQHGKEFAATEAHFMVLGAIGFFCYAASASWVLMRYKPRAISATVALLPIWFATSVALWFFATR